MINRNQWKRFGQAVKELFIGGVVILSIIFIGISMYAFVGMDW